MKFNIGQYTIGNGEKPFIVAEIAASHNGNKFAATQLIREAKMAGAHAVKFQLYSPDTITVDSKHEDFMLKSGPWKGQSLHELYKKAHTPREWFPELFRISVESGLIPFSSVFHPSDVDYLEDLGCPVYKVSSFDLEDTQLITRLVKTGKPIILSTGMASWEEICETDDLIPPEYPHAYLHCVSGYPTPPEESNLHMIERLKALGVPVGLSDHSMGNLAAAIAVSHGACIIEKHIKLPADETSPDSKFAIIPAKFAAMAVAIQISHRAMQVTPAYSQESQKAARKSVRALREIHPGEIFSEDNIRPCRPQGGASPRLYPEFLGKTAKRSYRPGDPVVADDLRD